MKACGEFSIPDCAGECYDPTLNPVPAHVKDCAGVCYNSATEKPPNFLDINGNCVDHLDCPPKPPCDIKICKRKDEYNCRPRRKKSEDKYLFVWCLVLLLVIVFINMMSRQRKLL